MDNDIIYVDKVGLPYLIMFHETYFEIIDSYYYNDGRHETINHAIEYLYKLRLNLKLSRESRTDGYQITYEFSVRENNNNTN